MCTGSYYGITGIQELTESCTLFQQNMHSWHCQHTAHDTCQHVSWQINFELSKEESLSLLVGCPSTDSQKTYKN